MSGIRSLLAAGLQIDGHYPWPCSVVDATTWQAAADMLAAGEITLLSVWAESNRVHMAILGTPDPNPRIASPQVASPQVAGSQIAGFMDPGLPDPASPGPGNSDPGEPTPHDPDSQIQDNNDPLIGVLSLDCPTGRYPSLGRVHPPAIRLERAIRDLFGLEPVGLPDTRPWLDHGRWGDETPPAASYPFLPVEGEALHQIPVGPVHAGIIEPGHFRFTCDGETVVRLEQRLGYVHKGIDGLMAGATVARATRLAARVSGDSTVAYSLGFARAVEAALRIEPPPRAIWLRAIMAELERVSNHLGDFGAICNDASFSIMLAHCAVLRERVLRAAATCFGHRLMMDRIIPGGISADIDDAAITLLRDLAVDVGAKFRPLVKLYDNTASLQDRTVTTGILKPELARRFGAGGYVGRASGRDFDARRSPGYPPYDALSFEVPVLMEGDVNARAWIRIREIEQSLSLLDQLLRDLPPGPVLESLDDSGPGPGEGMALVEAFRGDLLVWLRIEQGLVDRCHLRDASWFQWPLLEVVIEGNIVADFPLCNKSFNCSYSGHDL